MDFFNFFRSFLRPPDRNFDNRMVEDDENNSIDPRQDVMKFNVFSEPLEMQRYFEHQINEILKQFGVENHEGILDSPFGSGSQPTVEAPSGNIRDHYLKPGFSKNVPRCDSDVDEKFHMNDLDSFLPSQNSEVTPYTRKPRIQLFGQSIMSRTVRSADGSIETHRTVRDHEGNEETTVTKQFGDKQYSVVTKTDKNGQKETIENMINMDKTDMDKFVDGPLLPPDGKKPPHWFPFDKLFK